MLFFFCSSDFMTELDSVCSCHWKYYEKVAYMENDSRGRVVWEDFFSKYCTSRILLVSLGVFV